MENMEQMVLNGSMQITYPRDFYIMNEEETAGYRAGEKGEGICLKAPDRHIILSIAWKKAGGFFNGLLMGNDLVKNMEPELFTAMR